MFLIKITMFFSGVSKLDDQEIKKGRKALCISP